MNKNEFETRWRDLTRAYAAMRDNHACIDCVNCERCISCTFCRNSSSLLRCNYCVDSQDCQDCSHGRNCSNCIGCHHCTACQHCVKSAYLVRCLHSTACNYCFGCVGLSNKDYHILNEPYDRKTYYDLTQRLSRELGISKT